LFTKIGVIGRSYSSSTNLPSVSSFTSTVGYLIWHDVAGQGIYSGQPGIGNVVVNLLLYGTGKSFSFYLNLIF
jgi:hypothetical protein